MPPTSSPTSPAQSPNRSQYRNCLTANTCCTSNAATAGTTGAVAAAGTSKKDTQNDSSGYHKGMVVFTITKGGLMYEAVIAGQKFKYTAGGKK